MFANQTSVKVLDLSYFIKLNFANEATYSSAFTNLSLEKFILPATVTQTDRQLFKSDRLKKADLVLFPPGYTRATQLISNGGNTAKVVFPDTFTNTIGTQYALFHYTSGGTTIICNATTPPTLAANLANNATISNIYVPDASVNAYKTASRWNSYASVIKGLSQYPGDIPKYPIRTVIS